MRTLLPNLRQLQNALEGGETGVERKVAATLSACATARTATVAVRKIMHLF
jgi:hypothetical protein